MSSEDLADLSSQTEKQKRLKEDKGRRKLKQLRKKLKNLDSFSDVGYSVADNPQGDGNCQFDALR